MATAGDRAAWIAAGRHVTFSPATLHTTNICDNDQCNRRVSGMPSSAWHSVDARLAESTGAYCLDGSLPGFWYQPPPKLPPGATTSRSWLVFLDGGAWCYDAHNCASRARGFKGTASEKKGVPRGNFWPYAGYMDASPTVNPTFAPFHRVHFHYCDGSSYTGDRAAPLVVAPGTAPIYLRGRRVLEAQLAAALDAGLRDATEVLFSGGSAGGIGALAAAHLVKAALPPSVSKFKVLIVSGFFLDRAASSASSAITSVADTSIAADDKPTCRRGRGAADKCIPWVHKMRRMCELHNCSRAVTSGGCGARLPESEQWRCLFGRHAATSLHAPTFFVNSALDSWALVNAWRRYARCRWDGDKQCTSAQSEADVAETNVMLRTFVRDLRASGALRRAGNGAFIYSCNEHVAGLASSAFKGYQIGGVTMRAALDAWWADGDDTPAARHTHLPCELRRRAAANASTVGTSVGLETTASSSSKGAGPKLLAHHACNPSCDVYRMKRRLSQECPCSP